MYKINFLKTIDKLNIELTPVNTTIDENVRWLANFLYNLDLQHKQVKTQVITIKITGLWPSTVSTVCQYIGALADQITGRGRMYFSNFCVVDGTNKSSTPLSVVYTEGERGNNGEYYSTTQFYAPDGTEVTYNPLYGEIILDCREIEYE